MTIWPTKCFYLEPWTYLLGTYLSWTFYLEPIFPFLPKLTSQFLLSGSRTLFHSSSNFENNKPCFPQNVSTIQKPLNNHDLQSKSHQIKTQKSGYITKSEWWRLPKANSEYTLKKMGKDICNSQYQQRAVIPTLTHQIIKTNSHQGKNGQRNWTECSLKRK